MWLQQCPPPLTNRKHRGSDYNPFSWLRLYAADGPCQAGQGGVGLGWTGLEIINRFRNP